MKTWCIEFERELEGKDVIHVKQAKKPTEKDAILSIRGGGFEFNDGYDEIINIYEV